MAFIVRIDRRQGKATFRTRVGHVFEIGRLIPRTAHVLVLRESLTVSSGGMFPKNGSSNLPMASSAFMNILAWVISRVEHLP
jgi:hypothetical protein